MKGVKGADVREGGKLSRPSQYGIRRSCDACGRKKKRCDGEQPCSRCVHSGCQCNYSKRRWHHPNHTKERQQPLSEERNPDADQANADVDHTTPDALLEHRLLPLKRCRLRASPATGLVGMRENAFLSDFFGCVGFLPLTSQSQIRETMIKLMVPAAPRQKPLFKSDRSREGWQFRALEGPGTNVSGVNKLATAPSVCTFWCAVALGALAKGSPIESVASYTQLAREALAADRAGSSDADLAKASAILAYLHSFTGDMEIFCEHIDLSESFLRASMEQGSPDINTGLSEFVQHCRKVCNVYTGTIDSSMAQERAPPKLVEVVTDGELYRYVVQSFSAFDHAVFAEARDRCAGAVGGFCYAGPHSQISNQDGPQPEEVSGAIAAVFGTSSSPEFEPLQETADRPSIRAGIGGLLINGTLVFGKAAKGDLDGTLERLDRSIEVFERYPGLCRCMMESHLSHMLLTMLAVINDPRARAMYERLRKAHNYCRLSQSVPIPPLVEWQGMAAICGDLHCRVIEDLIQNEIKANELSPDPVGDSAGATRNSRNLCGQRKSEISATGIDCGDINRFVPACPNSSWAEANAMSKCSQIQDHAGIRCCAGGAAVPLVPPFYASSQSDTELDSDCSIDGVCARAGDSLPGSAGIDGCQMGSTEPEDNEIAPADWLEVAYAMLDAAQTS